MFISFFTTKTIHELQLVFQFQVEYSFVHTRQEIRDVMMAVQFVWQVLSFPFMSALTFNGGDYVFRYQRGSRSLAENLQPASAPAGIASKTTVTKEDDYDDENYDIPEETEDVIGE